MGQYHYLVNLSKKEYVHPHQIGNGLKLLEQVGWEHSTSTALVMLLAASNGEGGRGGGDFRSGDKLIGSWAGDKIAFIGDYAETTDIPGVDNEGQEYNAVKIYEEIEHNKKTWKNISSQVRKMMSKEFNIVYKGEKDSWLEIVENTK